MNVRILIASKGAYSSCLLAAIILLLPSLNGQESLTIDSLVASRIHWPREVTVNVAHQVPLLVSGKLSGSMQVPPGRSYPVKSVEAGGVVVDALGSSLTFPSTDTDIVARAQIAKARLEALAAARAAATPSGKELPQSTAPSPTPAAPTNKIVDQLDGKLVVCNGRSLERFDASSLKDKKYLAVYFSASWCGPCKEFTPRLVDWYKQHKPQLDKFEIIFASCDRTKQDMLDYMKQDQMPWPALNFTIAKQGNSVLEKYAGESIPCLVLIDGEGNVLSDSYKGGQYVGPSKVMKDLDGLLVAQ